MKRYTTITTQTPMAIKIAHTYLKRLDFVGFINKHVEWDEKQVNLTPGQLALSVVLSTFCSNRYPLSRISQHFTSMNTQLLFGSGVKAPELNDDAIARTLDKIYEAGPSTLYSQLALSAFTTLMMLIHVALMIRALMQQQARLRVKEGKQSTLIDLTGQKLLNPTADKILVLLINHAVITDGDEHYYAGCPDKDFERLQTLLNLLGITEGELLVAE